MMEQMTARVVAKFEEDSITLVVPLTDGIGIILPIPMEEFITWKITTWHNDPVSGLIETMGWLVQVGITPEQYAKWYNMQSHSFDKNDLPEQVKETILLAYQELLESLEENQEEYKEQFRLMKEEMKLNEEFTGIRFPRRNSGLQA